MRRFGLLILSIGCTNGPQGATLSGGETGETGRTEQPWPGVTPPGTTDASPPATSSGSSSVGELTGPGIYDVAAPDDLPDAELCHVVDDLDAPPPCEESGPANAFEPALEWTFTGDDEPYAIAVPLVANLTDDDANGSVDLCDTPDVLVVTYTQLGGEGHIRVLDGASGNEHFALEPAVHPTVTPAVGDIDGDGRVEVVSVTAGGSSLVAWSNEGEVEWDVAIVWPGYAYASIAIADLDNDGSPEIIAGNLVFDAAGNLLAAGPPEPETLDGPWFDSVPADLDGDGDLEVVLGHAAIHHDGTSYYEREFVRPGFVHVADLDDDDDPEILLADDLGITILDHEGAVQAGPVSPFGPPEDMFAYLRPAFIHDIDGDGRPEIGVSHSTNFAMFEANTDVAWTAFVTDATGTAGGAAFDFLGDTTAEAVYADESSLFVFDDVGGVLLEEPRRSTTGVEYPVVADIDNDGSAEILVVGNGGPAGRGYPTLQAIGDADDRWVAARRIWNQFNYHVTNVREDGTIPTFETPHWRSLNTFRAQAQIATDGEVCLPAG